MGLKRWWVGLLLVWAAVYAAGCAQELAVAPPASVGAALRSLGARAGDIFVGQVASITRKSGVVEIVFRVDSTLQGSAQHSYTLREWPGLWPPGQHRYWVGERAMVFLRPGSGAGLSTPVDGPDGIVPVLVQGTALEPMVDVRRLAARVQRNITDPLPDESTASITLGDATSLASGWRRPVWREPVRRPLPPAFHAAPPRLNVPVRIVPGRTRVVLDADLTPGVPDVR